MCKFICFFFTLYQAYPLSKRCCSGLYFTQAFPSSRAFQCMRWSLTLVEFLWMLALYRPRSPEWWSHIRPLRGEPFPWSIRSFYKDILLLCLLLRIEERVCSPAISWHPKNIFLMEIWDLSWTYRHSTKIQSTCLLIRTSQAGWLVWKINLKGTFMSLWFVGTRRSYILP